MNDYQYEVSSGSLTATCENGIDVDGVVQRLIAMGRTLGQISICLVRKLTAEEKAEWYRQNVDEEGERGEIPAPF